MVEIQAQLEAVLRGIEERVSHDEQCIVTRRHGGVGFCYCQDRAARVRAEQARTVERMVEAAIHAYEPYAPDFGDVAWAAALRAGEEPRT